MSEKQTWAVISIVFLLKKTHLVLVYNAEIMAVEITVIDLDLYGEHRPEERITGSKTDLDLSAGSTYTRVYMVPRRATMKEKV